MSNNVEVAYLDASHPNFEAEYKIVIHKDLEDFYGKIEELKNTLANNEFSKTIQVAQTPNAFDALYISGHLYQPLLYLDEKRYNHPEIGNLIEIKPVQLNQGERDFVCDIQRYFDNNPEFFADKKLFLLRNKSKKGIGFFDATGFYPDFIVWVVVGEHQYVSFVDPKGISHINGFSNPKIALHKVIREEIEPKLNDADISLSSFIISNTPFAAIKHWLDFEPNIMKTVEQMKEFNKHNILFQNDQKDMYVKMMIETMLS